MTFLLLALLLNTYEAKIIRVIDGDTVQVSIPIWLDLEQKAIIRVRGIDTPELRGKCQGESNLALKAKAFTASLLPIGSSVFIHRVDHDKYGGRYNADLSLNDGRKLSELLINEKLARAYAGGKREGWC